MAKNHSSAVCYPELWCTTNCVLHGGGEIRKSVSTRADVSCFWGQLQYRGCRSRRPFHLTITGEDTLSRSSLVLFLGPQWGACGRGRSLVPRGGFTQWCISCCWSMAASGDHVRNVCLLTIWRRTRRSARSTVLHPKSTPSVLVTRPREATHDGTGMNTREPKDGGSGFCASQ